MFLERMGTEYRMTPDSTKSETIAHNVFPDAQQKVSRLEVGGLGVRELTGNPCGAFASVQKARVVLAMKTHCSGGGDFMFCY